MDIACRGILHGAVSFHPGGLRGCVLEEPPICPRDPGTARGRGFETLTYLDWFNHRRPHDLVANGPGRTTSAAFEAGYNCQNVPTA